MSLTDMVQVQGTNPNGETCMSPSCGLMFYHHRGSGLQLYTDQLCQLVGVSWLWSTCDLPRPSHVPQLYKLVFPKQRKTRDDASPVMEELH